MWKLMREMCGLGQGAHAASWCAQQDQSPLEIVKRRYAQGEITREQFEELKRALSVLDASAANQHEHHQ